MGMDMHNLARVPVRLILGSARVCLEQTRLNQIRTDEKRRGLTGGRFHNAVQLAGHPDIGNLYTQYHTPTTTLPELVNLVKEDVNFRGLLTDPAFMEDAILVGVTLLKERGFCAKDIIRALLPLSEELFQDQEQAKTLRPIFTGIVIYAATVNISARLDDALITNEDFDVLCQAVAEISDLVFRGNVLRAATMAISHPILRGNILCAATEDISDPRLRGNLLCAATEDISDPILRGTVLGQAVVVNISDPIVRGTVLRQATVDIHDPIVRGTLLRQATAGISDPIELFFVLRELGTVESSADTFDLLKHLFTDWFSQRNR